MTGKADALFQKIHFESGVLRKEQIDPFGSTVVYDSRTNRFVYKSREETQEEARRQASLGEIATLRTLRDSLDEKTDAAARQEVERVILQHIRGLAPAPVGEGQPGMSALPTVANEMALLSDRAERLRRDVRGLVEASETVKKRVEDVSKRQELPANVKDAAKEALSDVGGCTADLKKLNGTDGNASKATTATATAAAKGRIAQAVAEKLAGQLERKIQVPEPETTTTIREDAKDYGVKAVDFAVDTNVAAKDLAGARLDAETATSNAQKALDSLAPAVAGLKAKDDLRGLARKSMTQLSDLVSRLRAHDAAWQELAEQAAVQAAAAGQIAATARFAAAAASGAVAGPTAPTTVWCPDGTPTRRGFQVLGPEGWRTFDQDERLLMAMSFSAQPLVSTLQQLANNVLNAQQVPSEALLPLVREQLRIVETTNVAKRFEETGGTVDQVVDGILATFNRDAAGGGAR